MCRLYLFMTLGQIFTELSNQGHVTPFFRSYLLTVLRQGPLFDWRSIPSEELPAFLERIKTHFPGPKKATWQQIQKALKTMVMDADYHGICSIPNGWVVEINARGRRFLWNSEWRAETIARRSIAHIGSLNALPERVHEWQQIQRSKSLLKEMRTVLGLGRAVRSLNQ